MEDKTVIYGSFRGNSNEDYFAVFDGHSGDSASIFASQNLHKIVANNLERVVDPTDAQSVSACFQVSFKECNTMMKEAKVDTGTTALVTWWCHNMFYIANAGDCRAVLCQGKKERRLTVDHKPSSPPERTRIEQIKGGFLDNKLRLQGRLSVARALGDFDLVPYVSCEPEVFGPFEWCTLESYQRLFSSKPTELTSPANTTTTTNTTTTVNNVEMEYGFLILACDGLWDVVTDRKAVKIVKKCKTPMESATTLRDRASRLGSKDNISVVVIYFPSYRPGDYSASSSTEEEEEDGRERMGLGRGGGERGGARGPRERSHGERRKSGKSVGSKSSLKDGNKKESRKSRREGRREGGEGKRLDMLKEKDSC
eukprot:TRINITY_DN8319_c0_g1_i1.p1 TRINITY_DN8319_c0_g1~~TRINITY_DN8319_c0_g1_i1.p1  ORF type:complete len:368 (+),score=103.11 TRINITY_DN8319_c0_g1_i1:423-1526(+)